MATATLSSVDQVIRDANSWSDFQERLGHSSISVTLDIYSHVVPGMQELAILQFGEALRIPVCS